MHRLLYDELLNWKSADNRKPLLLMGARQVGKTWLIEDFGKKEFRKIHIFNFQEEPSLSSIFKESLNPEKIIKALELSFSVVINAEEDLIFFDEIQECSEAVTSLKFFNEKKPEAAVCCAGSHIGVTRIETSFPVGKINTLTLYPMNFKEFVINSFPEMSELLQNAQTIPEILHNKLSGLLKQYYAVGGMPEAVKLYNEEKTITSANFTKIRNIQKQIITGYESDFAKHAGKVNANHIIRVFQNIPSQIMKDIDSSVERYRFKEVIPGYSKYSQLAGPIDWLIKTGLCHPVYLIEKPSIPLKANRKENIFKLMLLDIGLLNCMNNLSAESILNQDFGSYKGYLAENYAAQELKSFGIETLYSWKGRTSEIEFITEEDNEIIPIEVKSGKRTARTKSLYVFESKYAPEHSYICSMQPYSEKKNRCNLPLYLLQSRFGRPQINKDKIKK